jgi:hypothetical protein
MVAGPRKTPGVIDTSPFAKTSMPTPNERNASIIKAESRECKGAVKSVGESAKADKTNSRLVSDFEPGRATTAFKGREAKGADQVGE